MMMAAAIVLGGLFGLLAAFFLYAESSPLVIARSARTGTPPST
jgi:hypothetical protein